MVRQNVRLTAYGFDVQGAWGHHYISANLPAFTPLGDHRAPLQMLTPRAYHVMNSSFANMPRQRAAMKQPALEMHPADAEARNLADGADVMVTNERGSVRARLSVTDAVTAGVVSLAGRWWSQPPETAAVSNLLSPSAWSAGGQPAYNEIFVEVSGA